MNLIFCDKKKNFSGKSKKVRIEWHRLVNAYLSQISRTMSSRNVMLEEKH